MIATMLALALAVQQTAPAQAPLADANPAPMRPLDPLNGQDARESWRSTPEARLQAARFGACIADASTAKASATLQRDFRNADYRNALRALSDNNNGCFGRRGRMRVSNLILAGAIAERLLERDPAPLGKRLVVAAGRPALATFGPSDAAAVCVVRSDPDGVARLFAADPASDAEKQALAPLRILLSRCASQPVEGNDDGVRAMLATAAFRAVAAAGKTD